MSSQAHYNCYKLVILITATNCNELLHIFSFDTQIIIMNIYDDQLSNRFIKIIRASFQPRITNCTSPCRVRCLSVGLSLSPPASLFLHLPCYLSFSSPVSLSFSVFLHFIPLSHPLYITLPPLPISPFSYICLTLTLTFPLYSPLSFPLSLSVSLSIFHSSVVGLFLFLCLPLSLDHPTSSVYLSFP